MLNKIKIIEDYIRSLPEAQAGHGSDHAFRVSNWAKKIAEAVNYQNIELAEAAGLLHDIGLEKALKEKKRGLHGKYGSDAAREFLIKNKLYSSNEIEEICGAIITHNTNRETKTKLGEILMDADILDLLGIVGIVRGIASEADKLIYDPKYIKGETWGFDVEGFNKRFDCSAGIGETIPDQLNFQASCVGNLSTEYAKKVAVPRVKAMRNFLIELEKEVMENSGNK